MKKVSEIKESKDEETALFLSLKRRSKERRQEENKKSEKELKKKRKRNCEDERRGGSHGSLVIYAFNNIIFSL